MRQPKKSVIGFLVLLTTNLLTATADDQTTGKLVINELMQSNIDCIMDDLHEFPDSWVELYNNSSIPVLLDKAPGSEQWQIARHVVLHPFEHQTLTLYRLDNTKPLEASDFDFHYTVSNFWTEPDVNLHWVLSIHK